MTPVSRVLACISSLIIVSSCGRIGYERIEVSSEPNNGRGGHAGAGGAGDASSGAGVSPSGAGAPGTAGRGAGGETGGAGGDAVAGTGTGPGGAGGTAGSPAGGTGGHAGPSPTCSGGGSYAKLWSFDSGDESWLLSLENGASGTLTWTDANGHTSAGSLLLSGMLGRGNQFGYVKSSPSNLGDLTGRVITAHVLQEPGALSANLYVLDASYRWADAGWVTLGVGGWTCLTFDLSAPAHAADGFDPVSALEVGVQLVGDGGTVYFDDIGY